MQIKPSSNRFASFGPDGELLALVADGLPEFPADLTDESVTDESLAILESAYLAAVADITAAVEADPNHVFDVDQAASLAQHVTALRNEAARRLAIVPAVAPEPPAVDADARAAALASLQGLDVPAATDDDGVLSAAVSQIDPAVQAEATAAAVTAAVTPIAEAMTTAVTTLAEAMRTPALPRRPISAGDIGGFRNGDQDPAPTVGGVPAGSRGTLVASSDVSGFPMGTPIESLPRLTDAMIARHKALGNSTNVENERIPVATYSMGDVPAERDLRQSERGEMMRKVLSVMGPEAIGVNPWTGREAPISRGGIAVVPGMSLALTASGGLAAPVEPYYPQLVLAEAMRPVAGAMTTFVAERGGIRGVTPPTIGGLLAAGTPGLFADGVTATSTSLVSATAAFTAADVGKSVVNAGSSTFIPTGTIINTVTNGTTVVLSAATTGTGTGQSFYLPSRNPNHLGPAVGVVTAAQDAAGAANTIKFTYDVPNGTQYEHDVYSVYTSLQFGNLTARTFPEQVEANILLANALAARVAETQMLNYITGWSTLFTGAKTFGTARQLLAQLEHMAAYYRNHNRMDPAAVVRVGLPAWSINAMRSDFLSSFMGGGIAGLQGISDDELSAFFEERHLLPFFYLDGPSDVNQLFPSPGSGAININGVNNATPIPIPDFPGSGATTSFRTQIVSFMWGEGTWLNLTTGELNLGLVRDSILNSQNKFRNFEEVWETPGFVGFESLRGVHTVAADGSYGAAASVVLGAGSGL